MSVFATTSAICAFFFHPPNQTHSAHSTSPPSNYCRALVAIYLCTTTIISQLYGTQGRRFHIEEAEKIGISCVLCVTSFRLLSPTDERHTMKIFANPWNDYLFAAGCMDLMVFSCLLKNILLFSCLGVPPRSLFHRPPKHTTRNVLDLLLQAG